MNEEDKRQYFGLEDFLGCLAVDDYYVYRYDNFKPDDPDAPWQLTKTKRADIEPGLIYELRWGDLVITLQREQ